MLSKETIDKVVTKKSKYLLIVAIMLYTVIFSAVTILKYYSFQTYAYDLGIYNQALHMPLYNGQLFYNTADLLANPSGSLFGIHFSPILFLMLPFYMLYPFPPTILVIQTFVLALGALPVFLLAAKHLGSEKWGLALAILYLLNPALHSVNWYDFHPEAFLPALLLFSLYFFDIKKMKLFLVSLILTLASIEFAAILLVFMAFYFIIKLKPWRRSQIDIVKMKFAVLTIVISFVWLFMSLQVIHSINPLVSPMSGEGFWGEIGAKSLLDVPRQAISNPERVVQALSFDLNLKVFYFLALFGFVAFLPIFEPLIVICLLPWLITCFMSNYHPFYQFGDQYPAYVISFLFYGAVLGLSKLIFHAKIVLPKKKVRIILGSLFCVSLILVPLYTPLNSMPLQSVSWLSYGYPDIDQHDRIVTSLLSYVPSNASVLTQNNLFPHLSNRPNVYVFPASVFYPPGKTFSVVLNDMLSRVDFVIGDLGTDDKVLPILLHYVSMEGSFGVYAAADGAVIMKRGYTGPPVFFEPVKHSFTPSAFILADGSTVKDPDSVSGYAFLHSTANQSSDLFWLGPYMFLLPGDYEATFRVKIDNTIEENILDLYVSYFLYKVTITHVGTNATGGNLRFGLSTDGNQSIQTSLTVKGTDFEKISQYQAFTLNFTVSDFGAYEFRGTSLSNSTNVYFSGVDLVQTNPLGNLYLQIQEDFS
jgi:uncharacterized membrane protein